ncbi:MAG: MBL fold metallo-hydrolase [Methanobacterium sp.]|nr:MBL fold metallo-hydrolase [Methanobacterium sp.]
MKIKNYQLKRSSYESWETIFNNPAPIEVQTYQTGSVLIELDGTFNPNHLKSPRIYGTVEVPILSHFLSHKKLGNFLLDAGLDKSYYLDPYGGVETPQKEEYIQDKNQNIGYQLGDNASKLKAVFLSHMHPDHIAGIRDLPKDIPVIVGKGEIEDYEPDLYGDFLKDVETVCEIDFQDSDTISPFSKCADLLGDGSLWAISTPGHTRGHMSFIVNGLMGPKLLTMDVAFIQENISYGVAPSDYTLNVEEAQRSLDMLIQFIRLFRGIEVTAGHAFP